MPCQYVVYGREVAPTTGHKHLQGFVYFKQPKSLKQLKEMHPTAHFEMTRGTSEQAIAYCKKEREVVERGEPPCQGKRSDIEAAVEMVKEGKSIKEIGEVLPVQVVKFHKGLQALAATLVPTRDWAPEVKWFYGSTGTGKTRTAYEEAGPAAYFKPMDTPFWEGYTGQENVILDDLRPGSFSFDQLLRVLDRYPLTVNIKGSSCSFAAKRIWITAPLCPRELFINHKTGEVFEHIEQLERRINEQRMFGAKDEGFCVESSFL